MSPQQPNHLLKCLFLLVTDLKNYILQRDQTRSDNDKQFENNWSDQVSKLLTRRKSLCVQRAQKMKALPWCSSSTEALTLTCGLTRRPESRELGEYKKIVSTKASFLKKSLSQVLQLYLSYCQLSICRVSKVVWKIREFCFLDIAKPCINI